jgi:hypothetical protein
MCIFITLMLLVLDIIAPNIVSLTKQVLVMPFDQQ